MADNLVRIGGLELKFLVDETQGDGRLVMFEYAMPPNTRVPAPHSHADVDETAYALEGVTTTTLDGAVHELRPGDSIFLPRGSVHMHENLSDRPARILNVLTPGTIGRRYFEELAAEVNKTPGQKPDRARVKEIMGKHGLVTE